jgi:hypothetical protein
MKEVTFMEKQVEQFTVKTDEGREYEIIVFQEYISVETPDNPHGVIPGQRRLATSTGHAVKLNKDYTIEIVETKEHARRV